MFDLYGESIKNLRYRNRWIIAVTHSVLINSMKTSKFIFRKKNNILWQEFRECCLSDFLNSHFLSYRYLKANEPALQYRVVIHQDC